MRFGVGRAAETVSWSEEGAEVCLGLEINLKSWKMNERSEILIILEGKYSNKN